MQIGIFSNGNRNNTVAKLSYDEDLHEIVVADRLGMREPGSASTAPSWRGRRPTSFPTRT
jgi:hypothetical protein